MRPVQSLVKQIQLILKEYLASGDAIEAQRCLRDLEVRIFFLRFCSLIHVILFMQISGTRFTCVCVYVSL